MEVTRGKYVLRFTTEYSRSVEIGEMLIQYRIDALAKFKEQHDEPSSAS